MNPVPTFAVAIALALAPAVRADALADTLTAQGLAETKPPTTGSELWSKLNHADERFVTLDAEQKLTVSSSQNRERRAPITFDAGTVKYIGIDYGEFGGGLYVNHYDKKEKPLLDANIQTLLPRGEDLYIVSGLAHMARDDGAIHKITRCATPSKPEQITLLPNAPQAVLLEQDPNGSARIVMAGSSNLMVVELEQKRPRLRVIYHDQFWSGCYPTSLVRHGEYYIFGIRGGVVAVTDRFFKKNEIRFFMQIEGAQKP